MTNKPPLDLSKLSKRDFAHKNKLSYEQEDMVIKLFNKKRVIVDAVAGAGKALANGSKVQTPNGPINIEDLEVGDDIFNTYGGVSQVKGVYPQGYKEVWEVEFSDGNVIECCEEHLWTYQRAYERTKKQGFRTETIKHIHSNESLRGSLASPRNNIYIPMTQPVSYSKKEQPIKPYTLGALIGDGGLSGEVMKISNKDSKVIERVNAEVEALGAKLAHSEEGDYNIVRLDRGEKSNIAEVLKQLKLKGTKSFNKFIPEQYKRGSEEQRIELLKGLIDTDGECGGFWYEYSTSSPQLSEDVKELVEGLGMTARVRVKKEPKYTYKGEERVGRDSYRLSIKPSERIPKLHTTDNHNTRWKKGQSEARRTIKQITPTQERKPMTCISVNSRDKLFLTDGFIATHNTVVLTQAMKALLDKDYIHSIYYVVFPVQEESLGYLPGGVSEKIEEYAVPFMEALIEAGVDPQSLDLAHMCDPLGNSLYKVVPHTYLRGRTIDGAGILIDEAQNGRIKELKKTFTRITDSCFVAIAGHVGQTDISESGFPAYIHHFKQGIETGHFPEIAIAQLSHDFRGEFSKYCDDIRT